MKGIMATKYPLYQVPIIPSIIVSNIVVVYLISFTSLTVLSYNLNTVSIFANALIYQTVRYVTLLFHHCAILPYLVKRTSEM